MARTAVLGGEAHSRGLLGGGRSKGDNRIRYGFGAIAVLSWYTTGGTVGLVLAAVFAATGFALTSKLLSGNSVVSTIALNVRWWRRSRKRLTEFAPPPGTDRVRPIRRGVKAERARKPVPVRSVPDGVGRVRELVYEAPAGGEVSVLAHTNPGRPAYLSAVLEVDGQPSGLYEQEDVDAAAERFGRLLVACGGPTSLIRGIQVVTRVVPLDSAEHERFVFGNRSPTAPARLVESYGELLGLARRSVEQYRNYVVARIPLDAGFAETAREFGDPGSGEVRCAMVHHEMTRLAALAANCGLRPVRLLGPQRLAALLRSLQDPDHYIDDVDGVSWENCWQRSRAERKYVVTNDKWATRIARVPAHGVSLEPVHMRWLSPLLIGVQPSVIRTVSMMIQLEPARVARKQARQDVAEDRGRLLADAGRVTDLGAEGALTASQQRLYDLRAGTGHSGVRWGMYLSITAPESAIRRASDVVLDRAGDAGLVDLAWLDRAHDLAQPTVWPLWRGLD
ncbi:MULTISPECIES: SCO6880 family protein [Saccharothrix]|uniref:SCO6880 family protein n=1 Tax=Saccharothrix TaxID=2071 RepID=UPI00093D32FE|nr:SCO6880 family protein [Saccharothrix sp. CB00851]OKI17330.1 hypothetical protein A6A25_41110 [Saccharothrix sp. CB00851]